MKVKPLQWSDDGKTAHGVGEWAVFVVQSLRDGWRWSVDLPGDFQEFPDDARYPTREAAQCAANRWHAATVLAWVETTPEKT